MTKKEMEEMFDKYGKVGDIFLPRHRDHGRGRGFGFVRFCEKYSQEDCVDDAKKKGFRCDGKDLRVDFAHTRPAVGSEPRYSGGRGDDRRGGDRRGGGGDDRRGGGGYNDRRGGGDDRRGGGGFGSFGGRGGDRDGGRGGGRDDRRRERSRSGDRRDR